MTTTIAAAPRSRWLETAGFAGVCVFVAAVQFSLWAAEIVLWLTMLAWIVTLIVNREGVEAPSMFVPLVVYAAATLVSVAFSLDPPASLYSAKQLLIFLVVQRGEGQSTGAGVAPTTSALLDHVAQPAAQPADPSLGPLA